MKRVLILAALVLSACANRPLRLATLPPRLHTVVVAPRTVEVTPAPIIAPRHRCRIPQTPDYSKTDGLIDAVSVHIAHEKQLEAALKACN